MNDVPSTVAFIGIVAAIAVSTTSPSAGTYAVAVIVPIDAVRWLFHIATRLVVYSLAAIEASDFVVT